LVKDLESGLVLRQF